MGILEKEAQKPRETSRLHCRRFYRRDFILEGRLNSFDFKDPLPNLILFQVSASDLSSDVRN